MNQNNIKSDEIQKAKIILQEAHDLLRDISHDLVPPLLVRFGLIYPKEILIQAFSLNFQAQFRPKKDTPKNLK